MRYTLKGELSGLLSVIQYHFAENIPLQIFGFSERVGAAPGLDQLKTQLVKETALLHPTSTILCRLGVGGGSSSGVWY